jgi:glycosidase
MQHGCSLQSKQARITTILARLSILALLTLVSLCSVAYDTGTAHAQNQRTAKSKLPTPWWHHLTNERALDAVRYGFTLQDVQNNLDSYQAQGYQVINLDWPISAGPVSLFGGFSASDYYHTDPRLAAPGTNADTDWSNFVTAVHKHGMAVISWFNPSYIWTGSPLFKQAEADVQTYGPVRANQPATSPARYFEWQLGAGSVNKPCDTCASSYLSRRWVTDANASYQGQTVSYYGVWSDQPSGDYASSEWQSYITGALKHWMDTGIDGFIFDASPLYLNCNASCVKNVLVATVHSYSNRVAFGELPTNTSAISNYGFDGSENTSFSANKPWSDAITTQNPSSIESSSTLSDRDARVALGGTSLEALNPSVLNNDQENLLAAATTVATGNYLVVKDTTSTSDGDGSQFGDFGTWPNSSSAPKLKAITDAVQNNAALDLSGIREQLPTNNDNKYYAFLRISPDGSSYALVILNYQNSQQTITVNLAGSNLNTSQKPIDLLNGGHGPQITSNSYTVTLPAWGYAFYGVK